jgi:excisionase family DNA binding protein
MQPDHEKLAYTIKEFCTLAGVGRSFVYEQIAEGLLRAVKAGGRTLILREDAAAYFDALPAFQAHSARAYERAKAANSKKTQLGPRPIDQASTKSCTSNTGGKGNRSAAKEAN